MDPIRKDPISRKKLERFRRSIQENIQIVKDFLAAMGSGDNAGLLALSAEDIAWIIPGEDWPLAGTRHGHAGLADVLQKASEAVETTFPAPEFVAQGDRVLVIGFATGTIKATNKTFEDNWVFAITVQNRKVAQIREYSDTQALARAEPRSKRTLIADLRLGWPPRRLRYIATSQHPRIGRRRLRL